MRFYENRKIAWVVLALCVVISVFGLGGLSILRERDEALTLFEYGADTGLSVRHSIDAYLDASSEAAHVMASEAEIYSVDSMITDTVRNLANRIGEETDIGARYMAYNELKTKVDQMYNKMYDAAVGDSFTSFKIAYDDFWGYEDMIARDDYHKSAREYNDLVNGFPGGIIADIYGQSPLSTFGG